MLNALYFPADRSRSKKIEVSITSIGQPFEEQHLGLAEYFGGTTPLQFTVTNYPVSLPISLDQNIVLFYERHVCLNLTPLFRSFDFS